MPVRKINLNFHLKCSEKLKKKNNWENFLLRIHPSYDSNSGSDTGPGQEGIPCQKGTKKEDKSFRVMIDDQHSQKGHVLLAARFSQSGAL